MESLCVFCGSSPGRSQGIVAAARCLGEELARRGITLVYGGAGIGLMGVVADAALAGGGRVVGVMPRFMVEREIAHPGLTELVLVETMHERKQRMAALAAGFVALPGGFGTLEEIFEMITWAQLRLHALPCALLNVDGFFDGLISFLDGAVADGFVRADQRNEIIVAREAPALFESLAAFRPGTAGKWSSGRCN
ncbi:MAG TPA: TIGR00730 family Rossman fold protein [Verrucomicrobiales bacterium]|nr:TIGR00730 family Rossman fold protein [Verrucomicrobiales bacterium]